MGMSTHVIGFIPDDDKTYKMHAKVLLACLEASINELPKETAEYFGSKYPDRTLFEQKLQVDIPVNKWQHEDSVGYELEVNKIPSGVAKIRFYNSY